MNAALRDMMREAARLTHTGQLNDATGLIQRALRGSKMSMKEPKELVPATFSVLDGIVLNRSMEAAAPHADQAGEGQFVNGSHTHAGLTRKYKLYVPPRHTGGSLPLVVMLHGCTQDANDFAAGTSMSERAREQGFFVLYPEQSQDGNAQRCWNWFARAHQQRDSGEPALLSDLTQSVIKLYGVDTRRVYIAGLSAGGAMADIVAAAYPEIFAAVGVHSGLPKGAATNVAGAFAAMKNGEPASRSTAKVADSMVPTIVFHGDQDQTVHPNNGAQIIASLRRNFDSVTMGEPKTEQGVAAGGHSYTRCTYATQSGESIAEHWTIKGAGHAWSGGSIAGSYTDAKGPDATREMLRFFFEHPMRTR